MKNESPFIHSFGIHVMGTWANWNEKTKQVLQDVGTESRKNILKDI